MLESIFNYCSNSGKYNSIMLPLYCNSKSVVCVCTGMCVRVCVYTCACGGQKPMSGIFLSHSLLDFSLEAGALFEVRAHWVCWTGWSVGFRNPPVSAFSLWCWVDRHSAVIFMCVLESWARNLMLSRQALHLPSHWCPGSIQDIFILRNKTRQEASSQ